MKENIFHPLMMEYFLKDVAEIKDQGYRHVN